MRTACQCWPVSEDLRRLLAFIEELFSLHETFIMSIT